MCVYFRSCLHTCYKCMCMYIHMKTWGQPCVFLNHVPPNFWGRFSHWISLIELARLARKHQGPSCLHSLSTGIAPAAFYMGVGFWMPLHFYGKPLSCLSHLLTPCNWICWSCLWVHCPRERERLALLIICHCVRLVLSQGPLACLWREMQPLDQESCIVSQMHWEFHRSPCYPLSSF